MPLPALPRLAHRPPATSLAAAIAALLCLGACSVTTRYTATPEQLAQAAQVPADEAATTALPVYRLVGANKPPKPVYVRAEDLRAAQPETLVAAAAPTVRSRRYSPMVTAGVTLTTIGSIISVVGSVIYFASPDNQLAGGIVALSAEPMMITGTVLWIVGLMRPPQEVAAGRPDIRYLPLATPATPMPGFGPPPAPVLSLRF
jgi:hypothetical protein